ncbi:MAG TPA: hypothetical protein VGK85_00105 [Myxococcaceae bacterium]|jgi:hypothetical protein
MIARLHLPADTASGSDTAPPRVGWFATLIGTIGAWVIYQLIWLFGRTRRREEVPWLLGPLGGQTIGETPYTEVAAAEGLTLERRAGRGGLLPSFSAMRSDAFDPGELHPLVSDFYEQTAGFAMDVWSRTYFPMSIGLALLVTTISRMVNQLNFPLSPLDTAHGISSEIILLRRPDGTVRYTGWFRTLTGQRRVLYTGFYMTERVPGASGPCVKVAFPMPHGNATVVLRPELGPGGSLVLDSSGAHFGDPGFYRLDARGPNRVRVWHIRTLKEKFHVYVDATGTLRCDHSVRFLGLPVLRLHYKMFRATGAPGVAEA